MFGKIWKNIGSRVWFLVSVILIVVLVAATIVVTCVPFLKRTFDQVFSGERRELVSGDPSIYQRYVSDYESKEATLQAAYALTEDIEEEGIILLKNEESALPMTEGKRVTVFGKNSVNLVYGGSGSSGASTDGAATLYDSLEDAGFTYNPVMKDFYDSSASGSGRAASPAMGTILAGFGTGETPVTSYTDTVRSSYADYNDAAIVVISRIGGEGFDLPRTMKTDFTANAEKIEGARNADDHYLQLDQNETDMIQEAAEHFEKVIVVINCSQAMELGFLDDPDHYAYSDKIKAAVWVGSPGFVGINALGRVLGGEVNPSGRTVDTYARDFKNDPTWANFGNNLENEGNRYVAETPNASDYTAFFVDYEEGIYVGYRYYETRGYTEAQAGNADWYDDNVVYPFGYGLSYTTFDWQLGDLSAATGSTIGADDEITVEVTVTNTGDKAGKDVVQLYYSAPYTAGQTEKAHVVLGAFAKTDMLYPASEAGEGKPNSQTVTLTFKVRDMASYDYSDADKDTNTGYEVDGGTYHVYVGRNAHDAWAGDGFDITYTVPGDGYNYDTDSDTENEIVNRFDDVSNHIETYLSRSDWDGTWPTTPTAEEKVVSRAFMDSLKFTVDDEGKKWEATETHRQPIKEKTADETTVKLYDLIDENNNVDYDDERWEELLDQLTIAQMADLIASGAYSTKAIDNISKPRTLDPDGPPGFTVFMGSTEVYGTCYYVSECVVSATWNIELAYAMGRMIGNEGIWGNEAGDGTPYSGWYAPAMNIHRSPFGGRNWEYYSEDGFLSGEMGAAVVQGAMSKGTYTYLKHFALNDQETNRDSDGLITWASEQVMRELYFRPFELSVKKGGSTAIMSSFNRIGTTWAGGSYELLTEVLRGEWGFRGMVITDYNLYRHMPADQMIRAGGDLNLTQYGAPSTSNSDLTPTQIACLRNATKNILYTVSRSNAMNGVGEGVVWRYLMPIWMIVLIVIDVVVFVGLAVWGFFAVRGALKKANAKKE